MTSKPTLKKRLEMRMWNDEGEAFLLTVRESDEGTVIITTRDFDGAERGREVFHAHEPVRGRIEGWLEGVLDYLYWTEPTMQRFASKK